MKKVILITGASSGIGKSTAIQLIKEGHTVYGAARRVKKMKDIEKAGGKVITLDVTKIEHIQTAVAQIIEKEGRIDVLFNNAGFATLGAVENVSMEDARYQFEVNLFGLAELTKEVLPHMRKQKSGTIINTSSVAGKVSSPLNAWYCASKFALEGWSDALRMEVAQFGINVVLIEPGAIKTEFLDVAYQPMIDAGMKGPYAQLTSSMAKLYDRFHKPGAASDPSVIAMAVSKAIKPSKPKTRYVVGRLAKPMVFLRKHLSDRLFDRIIISNVK